MSDATAVSPGSDGGSQRDPLRKRITWWVQHRPGTVSIYFLAIAVVGFLTEGQDQLWVTVLVWVNLLLFVLMVGTYRSHSRVGCPRCMTSVPLDPEAAVRKRDRLLRLHHRTTTKRARGWILVSVLAGLAVMAVLRTFVPFVLVQAVIAYMNFAGGVHQTLAPWCPYCRRWGRGDDGPREPSPTPAPVGETEKGGNPCRSPKTTVSR